MVTRDLEPVVVQEPTLDKFPSSCQCSFFQNQISRHVKYLRHLFRGARRESKAWNWKLFSKQRESGRETRWSVELRLTGRQVSGRIAERRIKVCRWPTNITMALTNKLINWIKSEAKFRDTRSTGNGKNLDPKALLVSIPGSFQYQDLLMIRSVLQRGLPLLHRLTTEEEADERDSQRWRLPGGAPSVSAEHRRRWMSVP